MPASLIKRCDEIGIALYGLKNMKIVTFDAQNMIRIHQMNKPTLLRGGQIQAVLFGCVEPINEILQLVRGSQNFMSAFFMQLIQMRQMKQSGVFAINNLNRWRLPVFLDTGLVTPL